MSTIIAVIIYGAFAIGYVAMLGLTERSAARYVRGETRVRHPRTTIVVRADAPAPVRAVTVVQPRPEVPAAA